jgi:ankyrin repeat protein
MADMLRKCGATSYRDSLTLLGAVEQGHGELTAVYLSRDADINMKSAYGMAALHVAAARGDALLVEMLMKAGADLNASGPLDRTPLHEAVYRGYGKVARLLVEANAEVNQRDAFGDTPLDDADEEDAELVRFLREHGARKAAELIRPKEK